MDLGRAFGYPFKDPNWIVKLLIGGVLSIVTLGILPIGYTVRVIRSVMQGNEETMPEWDDFGGDLIRGIMVYVGSLVYFIPLILVSCCIGLIGAVSEDLAGVLNCLFAPIAFVYSIAASLALLPAVLQYAATDDFSGSYFNFGARFSEITASLGNLVMLVIYVWIVQFAVGIVATIGLIACGIGLLVPFVGYVIGGHLLAQYGQSSGLGLPAKRGGEIF